MMVAGSHGSKVCHFTSVHPWNDTRIFHKMCKSLAKPGHEVHLVAARGPEISERYISDVHIHRISDPVNRLARIIRTTRAVLVMAESLSADIYHFHDPEFLPWAVRFQDRVGAPVIYDAHEDYRVHMGKHWLPKCLHGLASASVGYFEDEAVRSLAAVVSATPHIAKRFANHPNSMVVQNFPSVDEFTPTKFGSERRHGAFTYVGSISEARGIVEMIQALSLAGPEVRLFLAGTWSPTSLRETCSRLKGWARVEDLGFIDRSAVGELLATVQGGIVVLHDLNNYLNSYPVKLFEYMAAGIPVIASDFPLWREIVEETGCGFLVNPLDPQAIANAMTWILDHPEEAVEMGRRGQKTVREKYNWDREAIKLLTLYKKLIAK
jgi:glycosyltransferase involved in cell wall biosynthesis